MKYLAERGITTRVYYPLPLHLQRCFANLGYKKGDFPVAEALADDVLALPMFPELLPEEQERIVSEIAGFLREARINGGKYRIIGVILDNVEVCG